MEAVVSNVDEKEGQMSMKETGRGKQKKDKKDKGRGVDGDKSIHSGYRKQSVEMEQAEASAHMAENPCSEHVEGGMSKSDVKKDKKKKKKDKDVDAIGQQQIPVATDENVGSDPAERNKGGGEHDSNSKKGKQKDQDGETATDGSTGDLIVSGEDKKRKRKEHLATLEEANKVDMSKMGETKKDRKKKRKESHTVGPDLRKNMQTGDGDHGNKQRTKNNDENESVKREKENVARNCKGHDVDGDKLIHSGYMNHSVKMDQAEVLSYTAEKPRSEYVEGSRSKSDVKKDKKKKKDKEVGTIGQKQILDATVESVVSEPAERNNGEEENDSNSIEAKRKDQDGETATNGSTGDQIVSAEDKKRKRKKEHLATLEEANKVDMSKMGEERKDKKKRRKESDTVGSDLRENTQTGDDDHGNKEKTKNNDANEGAKRKKENVAQRKDKGRRVSFTDNVEVFSIDGVDDKEGDGNGESGLVHGQRFSQEEDAKLMEAIMNYGEMKQLGEKAIEMIRNNAKYPELRGCWADIATSLPHRPVVAVYKRARILLYRSAERKWTSEEYEIIRRSVEKGGIGWQKLAMALGKSDIHVKDAWRRIKPKNLKKGPWTQDEYQNLFDLVNLDLRVKAHQKIDSGRRLLKDNISWEAISEKLTTRSNKDCCLKWYQQLASPLVKQGVWADTDDYLMVEALQRVDAACVEDVDWESLLDHRSGELCRQRWKQMVRMIGDHREKPFIEQVEVLSRRYRPEMLGYRKGEAGDLHDKLPGSDL